MAEDTQNTTPFTPEQQEPAAQQETATQENTEQQEEQAQNTEPEQEEPEEMLTDDEPEQDESEDKQKEPEPQVQAPAPVTVAAPAESGLIDENDRAELDAALKAGIKEEYFPNTKLFREGVIEEAKQAVIDELGAEDFDPYDAEHQLLFSEKSREISARREGSYNRMVNQITNQVNRRRYAQTVSEELKKIADTPEKLAAVNSTLGGMSVNAYNKLMTEVSSGKPDSLFDIAKRAVGYKTKSAAKQVSKQVEQPATEDDSTYKFIFGDD